MALVVHKNSSVEYKEVRVARTHHDEAKHGAGPGAGRPLIKRFKIRVKPGTFTTNAMDAFKHGNLPLTLENLHEIVGISHKAIGVKPPSEKTEYFKSEGPQGVQLDIFTDPNQVRVYVYHPIHSPVIAMGRHNKVIRASQLVFNSNFAPQSAASVVRSTSREDLPGIKHCITMQRAASHVSFQLDVSPKALEDIPNTYQKYPPSDYFRYMPLYSGNLSQLLSKFIPPDCLPSIFISLLNQLNDIHRQGLIHSNLILNNILFKDHDANIKVLISDFGSHGNFASTEGSKRRNLEVYPPEDWKNNLEPKLGTPAGDVWALGCVFLSVIFSSAYGKLSEPGWFKVLRLIEKCNQLLSNKIFNGEAKENKETNFRWQLPTFRCDFRALAFLLPIQSKSKAYEKEWNTVSKELADYNLLVGYIERNPSPSLEDKEWLSLLKKNLTKRMDDVWDVLQSPGIGWEQPSAFSFPPPFKDHPSSFVCLEMIKHMMDVNPESRWTVEKLIQTYGESLSSIQTKRPSVEHKAAPVGLPHHDESKYCVGPGAGPVIKQVNIPDATSAMDPGHVANAIDALKRVNISCTLKQLNEIIVIAKNILGAKPTSEDPNYYERPGPKEMGVMLDIFQHSDKVHVYVYHPTASPLVAEGRYKRITKAAWFAFNPEFNLFYPYTAMRATARENFKGVDHIKSIQDAAYYTPETLDVSLMADKSRKDLALSTKASDYFMYMKAYSGNLSQLIARGLSAQYLPSIFLSLLKRLKTIHDAKKAHSELCLSSVLYKNKGTTVETIICDYGSFTSPIRKFESYPPEQLKVLPVEEIGTPAGDIWALGSIFMTLIYSSASQRKEVLEPGWITVLRMIEKMSLLLSTKTFVNCEDEKEKNPSCAIRSQFDLQAFKHFAPQQFPQLALWQPSISRNNMMDNFSSINAIVASIERTSQPTLQDKQWLEEVRETLHLNLKTIWEKLTSCESNREFPNVFSNPFVQRDASIGAVCLNITKQMLTVDPAKRYSVDQLLSVYEAQLQEMIANSQAKTIKNINLEWAKVVPKERRLITQEFFNLFSESVEKNEFFSHWFRLEKPDVEVDYDPDQDEFSVNLKTQAGFTGTSKASFRQFSITFKPNEPPSGSLRCMLSLKNVAFRDEHRKEAEIAKKLGDKYPEFFPKVYAYHDDKTVSFQRVEFCKEDLHAFFTQYFNLDLIEREKVKLSFIYSLLHILNIFQKEGIVHSDFHSKNLLVTEKRTLKATDFGNANSNRTIFSVLSPERLEGYRASGRSPMADHKDDVWAMGMTVYKLINGNFPRWSRLLEILQNIHHIDFCEKKGDETKESGVLKTKLSEFSQKLKEFSANRIVAVEASKEFIDAFYPVMQSGFDLLNLKKADVSLKETVLMIKEQIMVLLTNIFKRWPQVLDEYAARPGTDKERCLRNLVHATLHPNKEMRLNGNQLIEQYGPHLERLLNDILNKSC